MTDRPEGVERLEVSVENFSTIAIYGMRNINFHADKRYKYDYKNHCFV